MVFVLSKLLLFLIKPIVWIFILLVCGVFNKNRIRKKRLIITGIVAFFIFSNSFLIGEIVNSYEVGYPNLKTYDYGIVLGGFSSLNKRSNTISFNWSADRLLQALTLYKKGVIKHILITSGNSSINEIGEKEADGVYAYLKGVGIPGSSILVEDQSRNTVENAKNSAQLIYKIDANAKILLITSAWHIPRAKLIFGKYFKENITYYPTNYIGKTEYSWSDFIIPSPTALTNWELLIKEWVGIVVDRFRVN